MSNEVTDLLITERRELADLCDRLTAEQWLAPSLCEGRLVRDVVAHLLGSYQDWKELVKPGTNTKHLNEAQIAKRRDWPTSQLLTEAQRDLQLPPLLKFGSFAENLLFDNWVHQQDIRWPLNLPRVQPPTRMRVILKIACKVGSKQIQGMRLVANDFEWTHGTGAEIVGPSEALAMMLAQRPSAWERLEGAGVARSRAARS